MALRFIIDTGVQWEPLNTSNAEQSRKIGSVLRPRKCPSRYAALLRPDPIHCVSQRQCRKRVDIFFKRIGFLAHSKKYVPNASYTYMCTRHLVRTRGGVAMSKTFRPIYSGPGHVFKSLDAGIYRRLD